MKLPRSISAGDLIKALKRFDYVVTRQIGSHIRITTQLHGEHHVTIPNHDPLKVGTLSGILSDIAKHLNVDKNELIQKLFG
jgi:predicted RNA binding protein YcfA (HicA-like mRNA interferase family)